MSMFKASRSLQTKGASVSVGTVICPWCPGPSVEVRGLDTPGLPPEAVRHVDNYYRDRVGPPDVGWGYNRGQGGQ